MNKEEHLLVCLGEESSEVNQAVSKALRFGMQDGYPGQLTTNSQDILNEFCDLCAVIELMQDEGMLPMIFTSLAWANMINAKKKKIKKWMEHAKNMGALDETGK